MTSSAAHGPSVEKQLAESREYLADALAQMPDGLAMFDTSGALLFCNPQYGSLFPKDAGTCVPGRTLRGILQAALAQGEFLIPPAGLADEPPGTHADLLRGLESREYQLADGRWIESRAKFTERGDCLLVSIDVTARREAARALAESEERYRVITDVTLEAWWEENLQKGTVTHSRRFCEMLGLGDDMLECPIEVFVDLIHPGDIAIVQEAFERSLRENDDYNAVYRLRHGGGHYIWVEDHGRVVRRDASGEAVRVLGAMTDITARKQAEMALQESERRYRQLAEITQEGWWEEDLEKQRYINSPRVCEMLGLGDEMREFDVPVYWDLIHPDDRERTHAAHDRAIHEAIDYRESFRLRHADGHYIWVEEYGRVIARDENGSPTRMLGAMTDITARKQAEIALQQSEASFRHLFDDAPDAYVIVDPDTGQILACNRATERMLRGTREQIMGKTPGDLAPAFQPDGSRSADTTPVMVQKILEKGYHRFEWMHRRLDDTDFWAEVTTTVGTFRQRRAIYGIWREIGEIIAAKQAAEAASTAKSQFLSVMSHELRTPLTAIMGMFQLIGMAGVSDKAREYVARGLNSSEHLLRIVEDILDFSSIESGRLTVVRLPFRMATMIDEVGNVAAGMRKPGVVFEVQADEDLRRLDFLGDSLRLKQVLINLLGNALKFTDSGSVTLSISRAGGTDETPLLEFAVTDTGIGLAPDQQSRLFQPFTQVDMSNARRFSGTGLGLVISQRLVSLMGGEPISVESKAGAGSRFAFRVALPLVNPASISNADPGAVSVPASEGRLAGLRVLVVEDSATVRFAIRLLLQSEGATVEEAEDGALGVKLALSTSQPFDMVLMDMQMPVQDGLAATRELRARGYSRAIVALTANAFATDMHDCLAAGMNDYVAKPVKLNDLVNVLLRNCKGAVETA